MKALVVYESLWGNTAAIAQAIAEGIGDDARAVSTAHADPAELADLDLLVAGAPILGFALPTEKMRASIGSNPVHREHPPDLEHPAVRTWIDTVPATTSGACAGFETRIWWSPGSSAKKIDRELQGRGYRQVATPERFIVEGTYGPLKEGELDRARAWGEQLASNVRG